MGSDMVTPISSFTPPFQTKGGMVGTMALLYPRLQYYLASCLGIVVEMTSPPSQEEGGVESGQTQDVAYALLPCFPSKNLGIAIPTILPPT